MSRSHVPPPEVVATQMDRLRALADAVEDRYFELHEAAFWSGGQNSSVTPGGRGGGESDPTGQAVVNGAQMMLRSQARQAAKVLRGVEPIMKNAAVILSESFVRSMDRDMRDQLENMDELAARVEKRRRGA